MIGEFKGIFPEVGQDVFIALSADVIGQVKLSEEASIWHNAVLRGDVDWIQIGARSNIQDCATVHCSYGIPVIVGNNVTVGHGAILHSCTIGDNTLVGMGAIILDGAVVGKNCLVAAGALITPRTVIPDGSLVVGSPAVVKKALSEEVIQKNIHNADEYVELAKSYMNIG